MFALRLLAVALVVAMALVPAEAKRCEMRDKKEIWKHNGGRFVNEPSGSRNWVEYNNDGDVQAKFTLQQRQGNQVVLTDSKRNLKLLLQDDLCAANQDGGSQFSQLYQGEWIKVMDCT
ncbi:hypothetical protein DIPPA_33223 [Diplonema papillatum]|nr:hypothetical protein DIPPA_33223 [Diplonema papillatum]